MYTIDLSGKTALITGVANKYSIAWAIAQKLSSAGMNLILTYQNEKLKRRVEELTSEMNNVKLYELDVTDEEKLRSVFEDMKEKGEKIHTLVHSIAYAPQEALGGSFVKIRKQDFLVALEISSYSLLALSREAKEIIEEGGNILTLTYYASEKVVPGYNVMAVAKSALETIVRYLAFEMGEKGIRVNAISAGPLNTLSARGIKGFTKIAEVYPQKAPLKRNITHKEVGNAVLFLASPLASGITGEVLFVDAGYHIMGI